MWWFRTVEALCYGEENKGGQNHHTAALNNTGAYFINENASEFALFGKVKTNWFILRN